MTIDLDPLETTKYSRKIADTDFAIEFCLQDFYFELEDKYNNYMFPAEEKNKAEYYRNNTFQGVKLPITNSVLGEMENRVPGLLKERAEELQERVDFYVPDKSMESEMGRILNKFEERAPKMLQRIEVSSSEETYEEILRAFKKAAEGGLTCPNKEDFNIYAEIKEMQKKSDREETVKLGTRDRAQLGLSPYAKTTMNIKPEIPYEMDWK